MDWDMSLPDEMKTISMKPTKAFFGILTITAVLPASLTAFSQCVSSPSRLVSWWRGEGNTSDQVGGNDGTWSGFGNTNTYGPGVVGQAFVFDGTHRDRVDVGNPTNLQLQNFTIEAWVKRSSSTVTAFDVVGADGSVCGATGGIFSYGRGGYGFGLNDNGGMVVTRVDMDGIVSAPLVTDTNWHHAAVTLSGSNAVFYLDGAAQVTPAYVHPAPFTFDAGTCGCTAAAAIGSRGDARGGTFFGTIDEVSVYNRALTAGEIQSIYSAGVAGKCTPPCPSHAAAATPVVEYGFVVAATITDGGCGYTNQPLVLIQGGGGTGATATAVVSNGIVTAITITDAGIGYTNTPTIFIGSAPSIGSQPQSLTANAGDNASFNVMDADFTPASYQWLFAGTNIPGAISSTLTVSNVNQADLGAYAVVITNPFGSVASSNAILSMYPFLAQPFEGAVTYWGTNVTFSVEAWGTGPLSYQWFDNGVAILNATNSVLSFASIQYTNAGVYSVVVSNQFGSVTNAPAEVVVNPAGVSIGLYPGITISGVIGVNYTIQSTTDLSNTNSWVTVANVTLTEPMQLWVDTNANASLPSNPHRFYQVLPTQ